MEPAEHWNRIYASCPAEQLGWYEAVPSPSLRLLDRCSLSLADPILDLGAGVSSFVDCLLERGFHHIYAADISPVALEQLKNRLGAEKSARVTWIVDDAAHPVWLAQLKNIGL